MSLINQVLNQLERRGAHTAPDMTAVRSVPVPAENIWLKPLSLVIVSTVVVVAVVWLVASLPRRSSATVSLKQPAVASAVAAPASSVLEMTPEVSSLPAGKLSYELSDVPASGQVQEIGRGKTFAPKREAAKALVPVQSPAAVTHADVEPKQPSMQSGSQNASSLKQVSRSQQADAEYRKAALLQQQGHAAEALAGYETTLKLNPQQDAARLASAALLLENGRGADGEKVLLDGLKLKPNQSTFSMALARMQVARGNVPQALETLQTNLPQAENKPEYQAFYAALLQREGRHKEALGHYQVALKFAPGNGIWLMGYGISLQALSRGDDAKTAYRQALATQTLSPELTAFVQQKLKGL